MSARYLHFAAVLALLPLGAWGASPSDSGTAQPPTAAKAAILRGFNYQLGPSPRIALPVLSATGQSATADDVGSVKLAAFQVNARPDETYRMVNLGLADEGNARPCDIFVWKSSSLLEFRALGAPLQPMDVPTPDGSFNARSNQANFPLVTIAW